jgi:hypothetical protein
MLGRPLFALGREKRRHHRLSSALMVLPIRSLP